VRGRKAKLPVPDVMEAQDPGGQPQSFRIAVRIAVSAIKTGDEMGFERKREVRERAEQVSQQSGSTAGTTYEKDRPAGGHRLSLASAPGEQFIRELFDAFGECGPAEAGAAGDGIAAQLHAQRIVLSQTLRVRQHLLDAVP
jgi:hypothetical protein